MARAKQWEQDEEGEEDFEGSVDEVEEEGVDALSEEDDGDEEVEEEEEEAGGERPGFAQYMSSNDEDEDDSEEEEESEEDEEVGEDEKDEEEEELREKMKNVPFHVLMKAQRSLARNGHSASDEEEDSEGDLEEDSEEDEFEADRRKAASASSRDDCSRNGTKKEQVLAQLQEAAQAKEAKERRERRAKERQEAAREIEKRADKHAPTEMSSRRPVSRKRRVVETSTDTRRDPRFSSLSASQANRGLFQTSYGFLREQQSSEVKQLRATLSKLKRQEAHHAGARAQSEQAIAVREERANVEQALRREEARENERKRREREGEVVRSEKKKIEERVKQGGKRYYLKDSDKKRLILEDTFKRLGGSGAGEDGKAADGEEKGAKRQLRKAMEKRRKKNAAKERKSMPLGGGGASSFARGRDQDTFSAPVPKRLRTGR